MCITSERQIDIVYLFIMFFCLKHVFIAAGRSDAAFVEKIKETIIMHRGRELLHFAKYPAFEDLVKDIVATCKPQAQLCLVEVTGHIRSIFQKAVNLTLGQYQDLELTVQVIVFVLVIVFGVTLQTRACVEKTKLKGL